MKHLGKSKRVIPTITLLVLVQLIGLIGIAVIQVAFAESDLRSSSPTQVVAVYQDDSHTFTSQGSQPTRLLGGTRDFASGTDIQPGLAYLPRQVSGISRLRI